MTFSEGEWRRLCDYPVMQGRLVFLKIDHPILRVVSVIGFAGEGGWMVPHWTKTSQTYEWERIGADLVLGWQPIAYPEADV
jgi:hypothetical protein